MTDVAPSRSAPWHVPRLLVGILCCGFAGLIMDIRGEHVEVVRRHWTAWIPIVYCGVMIVLTGVTAVVWKTWLRRILFWAFVPALVIGPLGFYFHNSGHMEETLTDSVRAWYSPEAQYDDGDPPHFAPMAFAGMGLLGLLATAEKSQPRAA